MSWGPEFRPIVVEARLAFLCLPLFFPFIQFRKPITGMLLSSSIQKRYFKLYVLVACNVAKNNIPVG
jgi:hypothetical protein